MHNLLRESIIASVRRRAEQGDCPIEPRVSIANLEYALLDTADDLQKALTPSLPLADREAIAREMYERFVGENGGFYNEEAGCGFGTWEELPDKSVWLSAAGFCLSLPPSPVGEGS